MAESGFNYSPLIAQLVIGLISGGLGAFLTAKFALGRFYKEKWWEKRAIAFNELIHSVYVVKESYQRALDECYEFHDSITGLTKEDWDKVAQIEIDMDKLSEIGQLTLTPHAARLLKAYGDRKRSLNAEVNSTDVDVPTAYSIMVDYSNELFNNLLNHARDELKISGLRKKIRRVKLIKKSSNKVA